MTDPALAELERRMAAGVTALGPTQLRPMWTVVGRDAEQKAEQAVRASIGDLSMSRWSRGRPKQITMKATVTAEGVDLGPASGSGGPWRVLESGRRGGKHGTTRGRRTWSTATELIANSAPRIVEEQVGTSLERAVLGG